MQETPSECLGLEIFINSIKPSPACSSSQALFQAIILVITELVTRLLNSVAFDSTIKINY